MVWNPRHPQRISSAILAVLVGICYALYALLQPLTPVQPHPTFHFTRAAETIPLTWPGYGESAIDAIGYGKLATHGAQTPLPTASVIKILTALTILEQKPLMLGEQGPIITINSEDVMAYDHFVSAGGSVVNVTVGEQISEYQALEALLLPSANNMADTLARWAFGTIDTQLTYANAYAQALGMQNTVVTDPSGFLSTTTSTPSDLLVLGETALQNPVIDEIMNQARATIPVQGMIANYNFELGQNGFIGIKTGNNDIDKGCFLFAVTQSVDTHPVTIVGVIMDAPNLSSALHDAVPLAHSAVAGFSVVPIVRAGQTVATYTTPWGSSAGAVTSSDLTLLAWRGMAIRTDLSLEQLAGPRNEGAVVGQLTVNSGAITDPTSDLVTLNHLSEAPSIWWRFTHPQ
jgi:D-alanyl-D-alanine carboxypeptidase (penicillin-binding protein 5/6)